MSIGSNINVELPGGRHACAACRHQRKRCEEDCVMAPYFTADREEEFKAVHKLFGVSNMTKLLKQLEDQNQRAQAVQSFIWEAYMWKNDPVNGPLGRYKALEQEIEYLRSQLINPNPNAIVLHQGKNNSSVSGINEAEGGGGGGGGVTVYGSGLNYGYSDRTLRLDHGSCTRCFTSLLQGQDTESSKSLADCVSVAYTYQAPISQQDHRRVGMDSFNFFHQCPTIQGGNNGFSHNYRPEQAQGRGRGRSCNGHVLQGQGSGLVAFDPHIRAMAPQVGPVISGRRHTGQRFSPYDHQQSPSQVPRQAMRQQDQNCQSFPALHQWNTNSLQSCDNSQDVEPVNQVKNEKQ